jgi:hypothetical protein
MCIEEGEAPAAKSPFFMNLETNMVEEKGMKPAKE